MQSLSASARLVQSHSGLAAPLFLSLGNLSVRKSNASFQTQSRPTSTKSNSSNKVFQGQSIPVRCFSGLQVQKPCLQCQQPFFANNTSGPTIARNPNAIFMRSPVVRGAATKRKEVVQSRDDGKKTALTTGEKVKQAGKDATYTGVVIVGIGVTGIMFYAIGRELFSGDSPNGIYTRAFKMCKKNDELTDALGTPLKGYGEMTRRGRRRHTNHTEFQVDGVKIMRMKFYVEGPFGKGTAQLEARKNEGEKYQFRYLFVSLDDYPHRTIIIEDKR